MTHKVHPKAFRIKEMSDWGSKGFYNKDFPGFLKQDLIIRDFLKKRLKDCGLEEIEIERFPEKIKIVVSSSRPGLIIGRGGSGIEEIKKNLQKELLKALGGPEKSKKGVFPSLKIEIKEIRDIWSNPNLVIGWIAQRIERRMNFRKVMKQALEKIILMKGIEGARIEVAGRLNGAEISRREWVSSGRMPRQTIRSDIKYGFGEAHCSYGIIGIKVWIFKGEQFD